MGVLTASVAALSLVAAWFGVRAMVAWAGERRLLDIPNERSSHTRPVPRGGGLPVVIVVVLAGILALSSAPVTGTAALLAGGAVIAAVGWLDDVRDLPASLRLAVQLVVAVAFVIVSGAPAQIAVPFVGDVSVGPAGAVLAVCWIVGLVNAYNFMDGIDGIAGAQAVVAGLGWAIIGVMAGDSLGALVGAGIAGACAGFLAWNWSPARIFMGDVGSTFLGFTLAALAARPAAAATGTGFVGLLLVAPFVLDAGATFLRRAFRGENVMSAHRSHLYQRLVQAGRPAPVVAAGYAAGAALAGAAAMMWWVGAIAR